MGTDNRYEGGDEYAVRMVRAVAGRLEGRYGWVSADRPDLEQDLMAAVWRSLPRYDPRRGTRRAYFSRVIRNRARKLIAAQKAACRDYRRSGASLQDPIGESSDGRVLERGESEQMHEYLRETDPRIPPEELQDLRIDLGRAMSSLPPSVQEPCNLLLQGMTVAEAARLLGVPPATFYGRLEKARAHLTREGIRDSTRKIRDIAPPSGR